jgi:hypothetical protein
MKTLLVVIGLMLAANVQAQIHVNPGTIFLVRSGTVVSTDSLTLTPNVDMNLQGLAIQVSYVPVPVPGSGNSIARVCNLISPLNFSGTVGLFFNNSQLNGNTAANLQLVYNDGTNNIITSGSVVNTSTNYITKIFPTAVSLSKVTAANGGVPLAQTIISFTATAEGKRARISWVTEGQQNADHYIVERSADGISWSTLVTTKAKQLPGMQVTYTTYDDQPTEGLNYYKLIVYELTGNNSEAGIRKVLFGSFQNEIQITRFPNPVTDFLTINFSALPPPEATIVLSDVSGRTISQIKVNGRFMKLPMTEMAPGIYTLSYHDNNTQQTWKVEKQ